MRKSINIFISTRLRTKYFLSNKNNFDNIKCEIKVFVQGDSTKDTSKYLPSDENLVT